MKQFLTLFFLCIVVLNSAVSCGTLPTGTQPTTDHSEMPAKPAFDADAAYDAILSECYRLLTQSSDSEDYPGDLFGLSEAALMLGTEAVNTIGYVFRDVNGDAIPELLIGTFDKDAEAYTQNEIYAAYTHDGQNPIPLFSGWARNAYALTEDNTFYHHGSGGAAYSIYGEYAMSDSGEFQCLHAYFTYPKNEEMNEIGYYHNTSGISDPAQAEELSIDAEDFWAAGDALAAKTVKLTATLFSAYTASDAGST